MSTKRKKISKITKFRMEKNGMTLEEFGKLFKPPVDKSTVSRWESGKIPPRRAMQIEKVTGIPRSVLVPQFFKSFEAAE